MTVGETGTRDYYDVLGVARDATAEQIKDAFRELALRYHPDRSTEPDAEERFKEIAEAYAVLSDPERRATYDRGGVVGLTPEDIFGGIDLEEIFGEGFGFDFGGGLFEGFFGGRRRRGPRRGRDVEAAIVVSLDEVVTGTSRSVELPRRAPCGVCRGTGAAPGTEPRPCEHCDGSGQHVTQRAEEHSVLRQITVCEQCRGRGTVIDSPCLACGGRGETNVTHRIEVTVPVGVESGTALRIPGHGEPSPDPDGAPGDAYVLVRVAPDPRFERRGPHLWRTETIDVVDAVLGAHVVTPTLDGTVRVDVPAGTQPGSILRLAGKGLPRSDDRGTGDLYLAVDVHVPTELDDEERALYETLRGRNRPAG